MQKQENNSAPISNAIIFKRTVIVLVFILSTFVILSAAFILLAFGMLGTGGVARGAVITSTLFAGLMLFLLFRTCRKQWRINPTKTSRVPFYIWFMAAAVIVLFLLIMIRSLTGSYFGLGGFF